MRRLFYFFSLLVLPVIVNAQEKPTFKVNDKACLEYIKYQHVAADTVHFQTEHFAGPALLLNDKKLPLQHKSGLAYSGQYENLSYTLAYKTKGTDFIIEISCKNKGSRDLEDFQFSLDLGINTCMTSYPNWRSTYFPTLLKCDKTHFWGYMMTPNGSVLCMASPDPVASYRLRYNNAQENFASGHLIYTATLDLMNPLPLNEDMPTNLSVLKKGESKSWSIHLRAISDLEELAKNVTDMTKAAVVDAERYNIFDGESFDVDIVSSAKPQVRLLAPNGVEKIMKVVRQGSNQYKVVYCPKEGKGLYKMTVEKSGKISTAYFSVLYNWSDYVDAARKAALKYRQKASSHTESWYGFFSAYDARLLMPDPETDQKVDELFNEVYPLMYDKETFLPTSWHNRIQNHAMMAALLAHKYHACGRIEDLVAASTLVDFLMNKQSADGAYRNGKTHYTSVIYIAKAIMEVMECEQQLAKSSKTWELVYNRHFVSVKRAMDELAKNLDNIETEGEMTYEDGMISCSYSQLAMFARFFPEGSAEREKYIKAAEFLLNGHRCLSQLKVPDSRVNGGSSRYWESQYDILTYPNFINSPHGWSAWRIYGLKYLYELTYHEKYLKDMINALGSCVQLLNPKTGVLNWAYVSDPYVKVKYFVEDPNHPGKGIHRDSIVGRQYLSMISDWYKAPAHTWVSGYWGYDGGCCDNDVHEIFKCLNEIAVTSAYFHLREDGSYIAWNCSAIKKGDKWIIKPRESYVKTLYTNRPELAVME